MTNLNTEEKRTLIRAIKEGYLSKSEVLNPNFNIKLYTLQYLPIFAERDLKTGLIEFMNEYITEDEFNAIMEYYQGIGNNQKVIIL